MHRSFNYLFSDGDLDSELRDQEDVCKQKTESIPKDQFLATPIDDIIDHIANQVMVEPLYIYEESMEMMQKEARVRVNDFGRNIEVPGLKLIISLPYSGDKVLWNLRPNSWHTSFPYGNVKQPNHEGIGIVEIVLEQAVDADKKNIKRELDEVLNDIKFYINNQKGQIDEFNKNIRTKVERLVSIRRKNLKKQNDIAEFLNIPLKRKEGVPSVKPIEVTRNLVRPLPPPPASGYKDEPGIHQEEYEHILSVIRHVGRTFETTPSTYAVHVEEELRDIILAHLNGHYKGNATGETFRKKGKTDIRIEDEKRAAFVAECKIWKGEKTVLEAIDQLMGYLTWRDCKSALIIFNKHNLKFSEILQKIPNLLLGHQLFKKDWGAVGDGEWSYIFRSEEDEARLIYLRVFLFNVYHKR
jgi:NTP pyrophosphatase (non-canonical NTP hydrolase)